MVLRDGNTSARVARLPVLKDKEIIRRRLEKGPEDQTVWLSTLGDIRWDTPSEDIITVEEARGRGHGTMRTQLQASCELGLRSTRNRNSCSVCLVMAFCGFLVDSAELALAPGAATAIAATTENKLEILNASRVRFATNQSRNAIRPRWIRCH